MEPDDSWLRSPEKVNERLRTLAAETVPYAVALIVSHEIRRLVGNVDIMPRSLMGRPQEDLAAALAQKTEQERQRVLTRLDPGTASQQATLVYEELQQAVAANKDGWKARIPGRPVFNRFAAAANVDSGRLKLMYLAEAAKKDFAAFSDVLEIFQSFAAPTQ
jgi:hypothetical protein